MGTAAISLAEKKMAARAVLEADDRGAVISAMAKAFATTKRTIRRWASQLRRGELGTKRPGPDPQPVARLDRQGICLMLAVLGGRVSEDLIRRLFPLATFSVIRGMKQRFKRVTKRWRRRRKSRLVWTRPGTAWAMDFTQPKAKLPGKNKRLLMVRDLASGYRLACVPCRGERAGSVIKTLETLFGIFGAPLVIKHDGGSAFLSGETQDMLEAHDVSSLCSPARTPEYNGSIERSLGHDKQRIEQIAEYEGHPGVWTEDDIEHAREQANVTLLPRHLKGATPKEAFTKRGRITAKEREAFQRTVSTLTQAELMKHVDERGRLLPRVGFETIQRRAIRDALVKHGYLVIRRGRISTPFPGSQPDRNS